MLCELSNSIFPIGKARRDECFLKERSGMEMIVPVSHSAQEAEGQIVISVVV